AEEPALAADPDSDLAAVVLGDIGISIGRNDEHACGLVAFVPDLVPSLGAAREADDIALPQLPVAVVHSHRGPAAQHDKKFLARVVEVIDELPLAGLKLPDRRAQGSCPNESPRPDAAPVGNLVPDVAAVLHTGSFSTGWHDMRSSASSAAQASSELVRGKRNSVVG